MRREAAATWVARIRTATLDDLPALLVLEKLFPSDQMTRRAWRRFLTSPTAIALVAVSPHPSILPPSPAPGAFEPLASNARQTVALTLTPHRITGNLLLLTRQGSRKARVYSVIVAPEARGQGLGEALVAAAEQTAVARGCKAMSLEVRVENAAALALYAKRGYVQTRQLPGYYSDGADGVRLVKAL